MVPGEGAEGYGEDVFSDADDGLDVSGSGDETSPPQRFPVDNGVIK
jgi:hypothetical protein